MCARFTVLSDTPIAAAIAGCVIPLSRNSTIWMRWRCAAGIFHRSAVFSRRTSAWLHLTICFPPNQMAQANHSLGTKNNSPSSLCRLKSSIQAVIEVVLYAVAYAYLGLIDGETMVREPITCLYFSIVTWTTLGYGDVRPSIDARFVAASEALLGYIWMAFLSGCSPYCSSSRPKGLLGFENSARKTGSR